MKALKIILVSAALVASALTHAQPTQQQPVNDFSGAYIGAKVGVNTSSASGEVNKASHTTMFPGLAIGYAFNAGPVVLGGEVFADLHHGSATFKDGGVDAKIGYPVNNLMPYARLGMTTDWPSTRFHYGLGVEYLLAKNVSLFTEWTGDTSHADNSHWKNNNFTIGANYRFK